MLPNQSSRCLIISAILMGFIAMFSSPHEASPYIPEAYGLPYHEDIYDVNELYHDEAPFDICDSESDSTVIGATAVNETNNPREQQAEFQSSERIHQFRPAMVQMTTQSVTTGDVGKDCAGMEGLAAYHEAAVSRVQSATTHDQDFDQESVGKQPPLSLDASILQFLNNNPSAKRSVNIETSEPANTTTGHDAAACEREVAERADSVIASSPEAPNDHHTTTEALKTHPVPKTVRALVMGAAAKAGRVASAAETVTSRPNSEAKRSMSGRPQTRSMTWVSRQPRNVTRATAKINSSTTAPKDVKSKVGRPVGRPRKTAARSTGHSREPLSEPPAKRSVRCKQSQVARVRIGLNGIQRSLYEKH